MLTSMYSKSYTYIGRRDNMVKQRILTKVLPPVRVAEETFTSIEKICSGKKQIPNFIREAILKKIKEETK